MNILSKFIIIEHRAKVAGLHFDLRFKKPNSNMWASFAVRKGVPTEPGKKVLAIRTNDHTKEEALLTGKIKEGYGAGKLVKWDSGSCLILKYETHHILLDLKGQKLKGLFHLVSTGVIDKDYKKPTYMLFKGKLVQESEDPGAGVGMISRVPPCDTEEVEISDEDADKQQTEPLTWSLNKRSNHGKMHSS
jgi:DNA ligase D-like protein (predicted 3'-phosphoesterase)